MRFQSGKKPRSGRPRTTDTLSKGSEMEKCFVLGLVGFGFFFWCFSLAEHKHMVDFSWTKIVRRGAARSCLHDWPCHYWFTVLEEYSLVPGRSRRCRRLVNIVVKPCVSCFDPIQIWSMTLRHPKVSSGFNLADIFFFACFMHTSSVNCYFWESGCFPGMEKLISVSN